MDHKSKKLILYYPTGIVFTIALIVLVYVFVAGQRPSENAAVVVDQTATEEGQMTYELETEATLQDSEIEDETVTGDVPAYEQPIEDLGTAIEEAKESVSESLEEGENPLTNGFVEDEAQTEAEELSTLTETEGEASYSCDFDDWVGETVAAIDLETVERPYRVLEPGAMYTMDHVPERINLHTDEEGIVLQVTCG